MPIRKITSNAGLLLILFGTLTDFANTQEVAGSDDRVFTVELGPAFERDMSSRVQSSGTMMGFEVTPIEDVHELEISASSLNENRQRITEGDVIFKKPYPMTENSEFMIGLGPEVDRRDGSDSANTKSLVFQLDFMFWPTKQVGWFFSPEYQYGLGKMRGNHTIGVSGGMLFGF